MTDTAEGCAGIDRYAYELTTRLIKSDMIQEVVLAHSENWTPQAGPWLDAKQSEKVKDFILPLPNGPFRKELRQTVIAPFMLNKLRKERIDIVHDLHHFAPFLLSFGGYKRVATVHDVTPFVTRWVHPWSRRTSFYIRYRYILPLILKRAHILIAVSNNTKNDLERYLGIMPDKVRVIYHGVSENYKHVQDPERLNKLRHCYGLNSPFILGQATAAPAENLGLLLEAFRLLKTNLSANSPRLESIKLVFFGHYDPNVISVIKDIGFQDEIIFLGYVPESDLPPLYSAAELFVYPSLYDGFGFPPIEAMSCGAPTLVSDVASLPEIVEDGALKFDPLNADGLAKAMNNVLTNDDVKKDLIVKGQKRAKCFSWDRTASETLKVYSELCDSKTN